MTPSADLFPKDKLIHETILANLPARAPDSHKGDFGSVGILGGAPGTIGAVLLAARAALHLGAGKVYAASNTIYVARQNNVLYSVLAQFFEPEDINTRLILIEITRLC